MTGPTIGKARTVPKKEIPVQFPGSVEAKRNGSGENSCAVVTDIATILEHVSNYCHEQEGEQWLARKVQFHTIRPHTAQLGAARTPVARRKLSLIV